MCLICIKVSYRFYNNRTVLTSTVQRVQYTMIYWINLLMYLKMNVFVICYVLFIQTFRLLVISSTGLNDGF